MENTGNYEQLTEETAKVLSAEIQDAIGDEYDVTISGYGEEQKLFYVPIWTKNGERKDQLITTLSSTRQWYNFQQMMLAFNQIKANLEQEKALEEQAVQFEADFDVEKPFGSPSANWHEEQADQDYMQDVLHGHI